jgi:glycosyltransferase involved in cell wall biosynthesis
MASFNQVKFVKQAIESVLSQTYQNFDLLIIDGGSTDGTQDIIKQYTNHSNIQVIIEVDQGMYHARNKGLLKAKGDIIGFLNTDDYYEPHALETINQAFFENDCDLVYGVMHAKTLDGSFVKSRGDENISLKERITKHIALPDQATFFKHDILSYLGLYDTTYKIISDWEFWQRAITLDLKFINVNEHIANFRRYKEALTSNPKYRNLRFNENVRLYRNYTNQCFSRHILNLYFNHYIKEIVKLILYGHRRAYLS